MSLRTSISLKDTDQILEIRIWESREEIQKLVFICEEVLESIGLLTAPASGETAIDGAWDPRLYQWLNLFSLRKGRFNYYYITAVVNRGEALTV